MIATGSGNTEKKWIPVFAFMELTVLQQKQKQTSNYANI